MEVSGLADAQRIFAADVHTLTNQPEPAAYLICRGFAIEPRELSGIVSAIEPIRPLYY